MTHSSEEIRRMHQALYEACGLEVPRMGISDQRAWCDFLAELEGLVDTEGGRLSVRDVVTVVGRMAAQKKAGLAGWSLRPSKILRDGELFRDLVLESRRKLRKPLPSSVERAVSHGGVTRLDRVAVEREAMSVGEVLEGKKPESGKLRAESGSGTGPPCFSGLRSQVSGFSPSGKLKPESGEDASEMRPYLTRESHEEMSEVERLDAIRQMREFLRG